MDIWKHASERFSEALGDNWEASDMHLIACDARLTSFVAQDAVYAFPVFGVAYMCHFNALPVHTEFMKPTIARGAPLPTFVRIHYLTHQFVKFLFYMTNHSFYMTNHSFYMTNRLSS